MNYRHIASVVSIIFVLALAALQAQSQQTPIELIQLEGKSILVKQMPAQNNALVQEYLSSHNINQIPYESLTPGTTRNVTLRAGNIEEKILGFESGQDKFTIHLIHCDQESQSCAFRVNGQATGALSTAADKANAITINEHYLLKIDTILFDYCDGRRFCDHHYQAYDMVNVSLVPRGIE